MTTLLLASLAAAPALGVFQVRSVDCTSPNSPMLVSPALFQSTAPGAGNTGPSEATILASSANQYAAFDSYVAIDSGPSHIGDPLTKNDGFQANPSDLSILGNPFAVAGQIGGLWFMDPQGARPRVDSVPNSLFDHRQALFLGRFSFRTTSGETPSGTITLGQDGIGIEIFEPIDPPGGGPIIVRFTAFDIPVYYGISPETMLPTELSGPPLVLTTRVFQAGPQPGGTARWEVHDLYIVEAPAPGTGVVAGLLLLGGLRRRR